MTSLSETFQFVMLIVEVCRLAGRYANSNVTASWPSLSSTLHSSPGTVLHFKENSMIHSAHDAMTA